MRGYRKRKNVRLSYSPHQKGNSCAIRDWRINFVILLVIVISATIVFRLVFLQILSAEALTEKARKQHLLFEKLKPKRGLIYIKDGGNNIIPIATNENRNMIVIVPKYIEDTEGTVKTLATALSIDEEEVRRKVMKREDLYEIIKRELTQEESKLLKEKNLKGVEIIPESWRSYPEGQLASQVLGFVGYSEGKRVGQYGIEGYFNGMLEGESGYLKAERDTAGRWISISKRILENPKNGTGIVLTLDQTVQYYTETLLEESVRKYGADTGSIIVLDAISGDVVAMANHPTFDLNKFNEVEDQAIFKNNCVTDQYEPGSVFKPFNASIAVDLGKLTPDSFYVDKGAYSIAGYTIHNSDGKAYGKTTLTQFLELSLNTGAIWVMQSSGKENFLKYLKKYGFGKPTGIKLMGEEKGDMNNLEYLRDINFVTASFGQGISVTPIQLLTGFAAVVNGGNLMKPQIVDRYIYDKDKGYGEEVEPKKVRKTISSKNSATMRAMLISVVKNGWGKKAAVPGYLIGGKTGTAQVPNENGGGYSDKTIHSFLGFGPADDPKFVTLVKLNNVTAVKFAADSAALVTGKMNKFLLDYYHIFPTEEIKDDELKYFNRIMELKEEDIKKVGEEDKEGSEGLSPLKEDKKDKKKKKKKD